MKTPPKNSPNTQQFNKVSKEALSTENELPFFIMADAAPYIIWILNPDGTRKYVNKYGLDYFSITQQEAQKLDLSSSIHPNDSAATTAAIAEAISSKTPYKREHRLLRHDGTYRWFLSQGAPVYSGKGEL